MNRRRFLVIASASLAGGTAALVAGCSSGDEASPTTSSGDPSGGLLEGVSIDVIRDPG